MSEKKSLPQWLYSEEELNEYEAFIMEHFGEYQNVFHEIVSPDIHLDVIIVPPTGKHPFYKLITMGMGAYPMQVPEALKEQQLEHAELLLYLPADWNIQSPREEDYWPLRQLKSIARLPIQCKTWLGGGHTIHGSSTMEPYAENTAFNSMLLLRALDLDYERLDLRMSSGKVINFYQLYPLYQEELDFKFRHSLGELLEKISDEDIIPVVNIHRQNYGK